MPGKSKVATELTYTENEMAALEILRSNAGTPLSAADLGIQPAVLTSLSKKAVKFPGQSPVINKDDREDVCPTCGHKHSYKVYWID